jgi:hypothetical protein
MSQTNTLPVIEAGKSGAPQRSVAVMNCTLSGKVAVTYVRRGLCPDIGVSNVDDKPRVGGNVRGRSQIHRHIGLTGGQRSGETCHRHDDGGQAKTQG